MEQSRTTADSSLSESASALQSSQVILALSLLVGLRAARANLVPGLCLQALMLAVVFAYYRVPIARPWFDSLGELKRETGYLFTVVSAVIAGALLPEIFKLCYLQRRLPVWRDMKEVLFSTCFYAVNALCVDFFYRWQSRWFGADATPLVLTKKVLVDQFVYNPLYASPFAVACFAWKNSGWSLPAVKNLFSLEAYARRVTPTLVANWFVWIPAVTVIYSLPPLLQIPIFSLALCFWALMLTWIHARPETVT